MSTAIHALNFLAQVSAAKADDQRSGANASQTLTIPAPGTGKAIVLLSVIAFYSDQSEHDVTISYTDRGGNAQTITLTTGSSSPPSRQEFPAVDVGGIATQENTAVTVNAPAAGTADQTSDVRAKWAEVNEGHLVSVLEE